MYIEQYGPDGGPDLVCLFGWGNRLSHENVQWFITQFVDAGYRVHAFELPLRLDDFYQDFLAPVEQYVTDLDSFRLVGHSTGGLLAAYVEGAQTETYLSPWWGFRESMFAPGELFLSLVSALPISRRVLPKASWTEAHLGELVTETELADSPEWIAPTFIREARSAQRHRPPIPEDAVVFCSLSDAIVSVQAIGEGVPADRTILYDGGHELFSSPSRDNHVGTLLTVVDRGADAL